MTATRATTGTPGTTEMSATTASNRYYWRQQDLPYNSSDRPKRNITDSNIIGGSSFEGTLAG